MSVSTVTTPCASSRTRAAELSTGRAAIRRRHAQADEPAAVAHLAGLRIATIPAELLRAGAQAFDQLARGVHPRRLFRILLRVVEDAEFDRIELQLVRHFVDGDFEGHRSRRVAGRAHGVAFGQIERRESRRRHAVRAGIQARARRGCPVSALPPGRLPDQVSCANAVIFPSGVAPRRTRWMVAGRCVELLAISGRGERHFHRPLRGARAERRQQHIGAQEQLSAEPAADVRRHHPHFRGIHLQRLRESPRGPAIIWLDGPDRELVALPRGDRGERLHHRVRLVRRGVGRVELHRRRGERAREIAGGRIRLVAELRLGLVRRVLRLREVVGAGSAT